MKICFTESVNPRQYNWQKKKDKDRIRKVKTMQLAKEEGQRQNP
jgi:hypothetical protein